MKWVIGILTVFILGYFAYGSFTDPNFWDEKRAEQAAAEAQPQDNTGFYVGGGIIIIIALWVTVSEIASHKAGTPILFVIGGIVLFVALSGLYFYGDENKDGKSDSKLTFSIQPTGEDAKTDLMYSEVNQGNAKANVFNISGLVMLIIVFVFAVFFFGFIGLMIGTFARE